MNKKIISPQTGIGFELLRGQKLKVIDPRGQQVADLFCFSKENPNDALSSGRSIDTSDTIYFTTGNSLYAQSGKAMLKILEDSCGRHDFLVTPCSLQMFQMIFKNESYHPSCLENLEKAFQSQPVHPHQIGTSFNIFMNVQLQTNGRISVEPPLSQPGDFIVFEAEMDLIVALTACSDEGTNNRRCKPIEFEIF